MSKVLKNLPWESLLKIFNTWFSIAVKYFWRIVFHHGIPGIKTLLFDISIFDKHRNSGQYTQKVLVLLPAWQYWLEMQQRSQYFSSVRHNQNVA